MACGGCSAARAASLAAAKAIAAGDKAGAAKAIADLEAIASGTFAEKPAKQALTRSVRAGLARLAARVR